MLVGLYIRARSLTVTSELIVEVRGAHCRKPPQVAALRGGGKVGPTPQALT
jgi:hypothetical protein